MRRTKLLAFASVAIVLASGGQLPAQFESAQTRMRPLGSPSAVDQFRNQAQPSNFVPQPRRGSNAAQPVSLTTSGGNVRNETAHWQMAASGQAPVRQTVWMQSGFEPPPLGNSGMGLPDTPPDAGLEQPEPATAIPNSTPFPEAAAPPRSLPTPPSASVAPVQPLGPSIASSSDYSPIPRPELGSNAFARVDNCPLVTPPSSYTAAMGINCCGQIVPASYCGPTYSGPATGPITTAPSSLPAEIASPATIPPVAQPLAYPSSAAPARSLITFGQEQYAVQVGQGLWGQPVAYVPGQWMRNWLRYLSF